MKNDTDFGFAKLVVNPMIGFFFGGNSHLSLGL